MIYDKDLRLLRRITIGINLINVALASYNATRHLWLSAACSAVWAFSGFWQLALFKIQQQWRESLRITHAGLRAIEERVRSGQ